LASGADHAEAGHPGGARYRVTFVATVLRNFAAYAAALAGYTAAIVASDQLGATGGPNGDAFMLAITRDTTNPSRTTRFMSFSHA
jgi:Fusaric acid resistance protein family